MSIKNAVLFGKNKSKYLKLNKMGIHDFLRNCATIPPKPKAAIMVPPTSNPCKTVQNPPTKAITQSKKARTCPVLFMEKSFCK